jgi:hypothetical protein
MRRWLVPLSFRWDMETFIRVPTQEDASHSGSHGLWRHLFINATRYYWEQLL